MNQSFNCKELGKPSCSDGERSVGSSPHTKQLLPLEKSEKPTSEDESHTVLKAG